MFFSAASNQMNQITSKERDAETGLDYFTFRYYSSPQGRFMKPDPENFGAAINDPQSWNGYAYVYNSPLRYIDRHGLEPECYLDGISVFCSNLNAWISSGAGVIVPAGWPLTYFDYDTNSFKMLMAGAGGAFGYVKFSELWQLNEWGGDFYNNSDFDRLILQPRQENQRRHLARNYVMESGLSYPQVYSNISFRETIGGNANFRWVRGQLDPLIDLNEMVRNRTPGMPSIHLKRSRRLDMDLLHVDTANPWWKIPIGFLIHGLIDVVFGNINGQVPILR